jgi:glycosyltransferase involved in cell wall biosynthesis
MSRYPRVSVLMCVYNGEAYVRDAVESILSQTFVDFEFLICNDGSTDATGEIVREYRDPRIRLIDNEGNIGLTRSLNLGLRVARGTFVARQDADDISERTRLARQVAFMERRSEVAMVGCWYREIDAAGRAGPRLRLPSRHIDLAWALLFYCPFVHSGVMLRREHFLRGIGLYDESFDYAQDHELWLRTSRTKPIANIRAYLLRYRVNPQSMTATYGERTQEGAKLAAATVSGLLGWNPHETEVNRLRFERIFALLYGHPSRLDVNDVAGTLATVWQLHDAFCSDHRLNRNEAAQRQATLRGWLGQRMIRFSREYAKQGRRAEAWRFYRQALRLSPRSLLTPNSVRAMGGLVTASLR